MGPYFFEDPDSGAPLTVTKECYTQMLRTIFPEDGEEVNSRCIFMQDGAPAHTSRMAMEFLEEKFPGRFITTNLILFGLLAHQTLIRATSSSGDT